MRILMLLLQHRADVNIRDRRGCMPLYDAAERNVPAAVRILVAWAPASNGLSVWEEAYGNSHSTMRRWEILKLVEQLSAEVCIEYQIYIMAVVIGSTGTNLRLDATRRDNA